MSDTDFIKVANRDELYVVNLLDVAYFKAEGHFTNVFYWRNRQTLWGGCTDANPKLLLNDT